VNSTKVSKTVLGQKVSVHSRVNTYVSTQEISIQSSSKIRIVHKVDDVEITSGYRKVNFSEQKKKEVYKKLNKMLGGN